MLAKVGGFEIAGLAGVMLGAAAHRLPILLDGFITGAAAWWRWVCVLRFAITSSPLIVPWNPAIP